MTMNEIKRRSKINSCNEEKCFLVSNVVFIQITITKFDFYKLHLKCGLIEHEVLDEQVVYHLVLIYFINKPYGLITPSVRQDSISEFIVTLNLEIELQHHFYTLDLHEYLSRLFVL